MSASSWDKLFNKGKENIMKEEMSRDDARWVLFKLSNQKLIDRANELGVVVSNKTREQVIEEMLDIDFPEP